MAEEGINNPSSEQLKEALDRLEEELYEIIFLLKAEKRGTVSVLNRW